jgi:5'-phosphate synthase pdxT subunit
VEVRTAEDLEDLDGLILPGGESTTIGMGLERDSLSDGVVELAGRGVPILGTCAGMILAGAGQLDLIDIDVRRNAFGRQLASFETELAIPRLVGEEPYRAIFIRAPWIERVGEGVEVLAEIDGHPVAASSGPVTVLSFHPELSTDDRIHQWFLGACRDARTT